MAGIIAKSTTGLISLFFRILTASWISLLLPFVQDPIITELISVPSTSSIDFTLGGCGGQATCKSKPWTSIVNSIEYFASLSASINSYSTWFC